MPIGVIAGASRRRVHALINGADRVAMVDADQWPARVVAGGQAARALHLVG